MAHQASVSGLNQDLSLIGANSTAQTAEARLFIVDDNNNLHVSVEAGTVITNSLVATGWNGGTVSVGTVAVEMTFTGTTQAIMITADQNNTGDIYIGGSTVGTEGANSITRLVVGESISVELNDGSAPLYAIGSITGQKVYKFALT